MGNHASAQLFYGVIAYDPNSDSPPPPWQDEYGEEIEDFDDWYIRNFTELQNPLGKYLEGESLDTLKALKDAQVFREAKREALAALPIVHDFVGYVDGDAVEILRLRDWGKSALDYDIELLTNRSVTVTEYHRETFCNALEQLGLSWLGTPNILLAATYG